MTTTRRFKLVYAFAAIPALFLPFTYVVAAGWLVGRIIPAVIAGKLSQVGEMPGNMVLLGWAGIVATFVQWPIYLIWAALSQELNLRKRILWMVVLIVMNMFAIPWFLYCKYRGTTGDAVTKGIRLKSVRRFFEEETGVGSGEK